MKILLTGGAGCLGSNLIDRFLPRGYEILVIDNFSTGKRGNLPRVEGLSVVEGSIADRDLVDRAFDQFKPDVVIHSAASYKDPTDWAEDARTNVLGTIHVAEAARRHKVAKLVHFQTALAYGRPDVLPIPADHPKRPFTSYGISKAAAESYLMMGDLPVVSLRLANVTGPRLAIGPIPTFYKRLKAGQSCFCSDTVRDFLDMEDFITLMDQVVQPHGPTGVFNVSTGQGHSIRDVFAAVAGYLGISPVPDVPIVPPGADDVPAVVLDPAETIKAFSWQPKIGFVATIHRMLSWYDAHGVTDVYSHLNAPTHQN